MITLLDCAKLSAYAYKDKPTLRAFSNYIKSKTLAKKLKSLEAYDGIHEIIIDDAIQSTAAQQHAFYASCFAKIKDHQIIGLVIAIRGTVFGMLSNVKADIQSWWRSVFSAHARVKVPDLFVHQAIMFYRKVHTFAKEKIKSA